MVSHVFQNCKLFLVALLGIASLTNLLVLATADEESLIPTSSSEEKIVITGSRIQEIDINNLSPILLITREDIDKFGYANVSDVISSLTQNTGGSINNGFVFGFTPGASAVNLRGVGFGQTLTLIDGRRLPIYPIGIGGTTNFVDLSAIPMAFVERIEILTNGASAVYGSDAVAGVINIITRKEIEGIALDLRTSNTTDGGFNTNRFNLLAGAKSGKAQLDVILDYWNQEALWASERSYANSDTSNPRGNYSFGGASFIGLESGNIYQDPNCGTSNGALAGEGIANVALSIYSNDDVWCGFDRSLSRQLIAPQERASLMTNIHYKINDDIDFFSRVGLSQLNTSTQLEANFYGGALLSGYGSLVPNNGGVVLAGAVNNPTTGTSLEEQGIYVRRLIEFGPRVEKIRNNAVNLLAGLKGSIVDGKYDWEFGISYNKTEVSIESNNILLSALNAEVENGLDLFQPIPRQTADFLGFIANENADSKNKIFDFSISGDLDTNLNGGPVKFAFVFEHVNESYLHQADKILQGGDGFDGFSSGSGRRKHIGVGGELNFPFSQNFEVGLALRWDDYKDDSRVNSAFSPRISIAYKPVESLLARFSWGESFRAPDMQRLFGGITKGFRDIVDPENGHSIIQSVQVFTDSNIELKEEHGTNINLGLVWEVSESIDLTLDFFEISLKDVIAAPDFQFIVDTCAEFDLLCDFIVRDQSGGLNGSDAYIVTGPINFAEQKAQGADLVVDFHLSNSLGRWSSQFKTTWMKAFYFQAIEKVKGVDNVGLGIFPEFRTQFMLDWQKESLGATFKLNYIDQISGAFCDICTEKDNINSWITLDSNLRYQYSDFTRVSVGVNNLLNKKPPQDPTQTNWPWFANGGSYYNAIGRELYLQLDMSF